MENKSFDELFCEVFDEDYNIKPCGREKCKQLIHLCNILNYEYQFGDEETGFMNVPNIIFLKEGAIKKITD